MTDNFFNIDHLTNDIFAKWRTAPDWETAAGIIISELAFSDGYSLESMDPEHIEAYYEDGRVDILARGALNDIAVHHEMSGTVGNVYTELVTTLAGKQADYGPRNILRFGEYGLEVRMWDKIARLINLRQKGANPDNESVNDTKLDIVGYTVILIMLELGWFTLPLQRELQAAQ